MISGTEILTSTSNLSGIMISPSEISNTEGVSWVCFYHRPQLIQTLSVQVLPSSLMGKLWS